MLNQDASVLVDGFFLCRRLDHQLLTPLQSAQFHEQIRTHGLAALSLAIEFLESDPPSLAARNVAQHGLSLLPAQRAVAQLSDAKQFGRFLRLEWENMLFYALQQKLALV